VLNGCGSWIKTVNVYIHNLYAKTYFPVSHQGPTAMMKDGSYRYSPNHLATMMLDTDRWSPEFQHVYAWISQQSNNRVQTETETETINKYQEKFLKLLACCRQFHISLPVEENELI
jgi:hypothetical protein